MPTHLEQLVHDVVGLTGAEPPTLFQDDAPVLTDAALRQTTDADQSFAISPAASPLIPAEGVYLIGLIGGKEVGKSALVNALAGKQITESTSYGEGTQIVTTYAHVTQAAYMRELLSREVPGKFQIVTHDDARLQRQVLLDLPDIDSHWQEHVEVTRRMLRHMLFPLWIQSVEKYADLQPQQLLAKVAAGNAAQNFIFCLNKVDQLFKAEGPEAAAEVAQDYGQRLARLLNLGSEPARVFMVSAIRPDDYDLPGLRELLGTQKTVAEVETSRQAAAKQQETTVWGWVQRQNLPDRARRLERLEEEVEEVINDRLGLPLIERTIRAILDDPAHRLTILDQTLKQRVGRWPLVNIVQTVAGPITSLFRKRLSPEQQRTLEGPDVLVETYLRHGDRDLAANVQTTFAYLHQAQPLIGTLYADRKLWEARPADMAAGRLSRELAQTVVRQRAAIATRVAGKSGPVGTFFRVLLTIGALLWFPLIQPLLEALLQDNAQTSMRHIALLIVKSMSVVVLAQSVSFLVIWYFLIWLVVRWDTQRRIDRQLARWKTTDEPNPELSLTAASMEWLTDLARPVRSARERVEQIIDRAESLRGDMERARAA
ncbi:MAG TPA: GTPase domain-containing protein [Tepidisphaeraceae bacterium]|nr:GTPase domain-containing protein [Tepidisphaeraceae bacterium]